MRTFALAVKASACRRVRVHSAPVAPGTARVSEAGKGASAEASAASPSATHKPALTEGDGVAVRDSGVLVPVVGAVAAGVLLAVDVCVALRV